MPIRRIVERIRLQRLKKEHEAYLREHGVKEVHAFWEMLKEHDERLHDRARSLIDEMHRKQIRSIMYRPSAEERQKLRELAEEIHRTVVPADPKLWEAILFKMQDHEEPYRTLGKILLELWIKRGGNRRD